MLAHSTSFGRTDGRRGHFDTLDALEKRADERRSALTEKCRGREESASVILAVVGTRVRTESFWQDCPAKSISTVHIAQVRIVRKPSSIALRARTPYRLISTPSSVSPNASERQTLNNDSG